MRGPRRRHQGQQSERVTSRNHEACRYLRPGLIACPYAADPDPYTFADDAHPYPSCASGIFAIMV
jgi:hypothetical protein